MNVLPIFILLPLGAGFLMLLTHRLGKRLPDFIANAAVFFLVFMAFSLYFFRTPGTVMLYRTGCLPEGAGC